MTARGDMRHMGGSNSVRTTVWRMLLLPALLLLPLLVAAQGVVSGDETFFPFAQPTSRDSKPAGVDEWQALEQRLAELEKVAEETEEHGESALLRWQSETTAIHDSITAHLEVLQARQEQLQSRLETLGEAAEDESPSIAEQRQLFSEQRKQIDAQLAGYRLLQLQSQEITKKLEQRRQQLLTEKFLARGVSSVSLLRQHGDLTWRWLGAGLQFVYNQSAAAFTAPSQLLNLGGLLIAGIALGLLLRRKSRRWCRQNRDSGYRYTLMVLGALGRYAPHLLAGLGATIFAHLSLDSAPQMLPYQLGISLPLFFLIWALLHLLFRGDDNVAALLPLPQGVGRGIGRSLKLLMLLAYGASLFSVTDASAEMSEPVLLFARDVFVLLTVLTLFWCCHYLQKWMREHEVQGLYGVLLLVLLGALVAEFSGYRNIAYWLLRTLIGSGLVVFMAWLLVLLLNEFFAGLRSGTLWWQKGVRRLLGYGIDESMPWLGWVSVLSVMAIWSVAVYGVLLVWGISRETLSRLSNYLLEGFQVGSLTIIPVRVVLAVVVFAVLLALSSWVRRRMERVWLAQSRMERGSREAMVTIFGYIGIALAILVALGVAGVKFTNLAIIAGALSVGIGFGLQNIVNNFVSGLILLFERPVKTGDWIMVGNTEGYVKRISIRSTLIQTFDRADVIVPNSELISGQVTNWMLYDPRGRIRIPVGVAYGSDTQKVKDILLQIAAEHPSVITDGSMTEPKVLFLTFGDSSLNFELRAFIKNIDERLQVVSDINFAIDAAFREAKVEIPFPQRDLHVRSWERPPEDQ